MIKPEELQVGLLVWWTRTNDNWGGSWNCPCIVTYVNHEGNRFKVFSLDDMRETKGDGLLITRPADDDDSSLNEMKLSNVDEVQKYLTDRSTKLGVECSKLHDEIIEKTNKIKEIDKVFYRVKTGNFMSYLSERDDRTIIS